MSGWDSGRVYAQQSFPGAAAASTQPNVVEKRFLDFLRDFRIDHSFHYRLQMRRNLLVPQYLLRVELKHLIAYDGDLAQLLVDKPDANMPLLESAAQTLAQQVILTAREVEEEPTRGRVPPVQVTLSSEADPVPIRGLSASHIAKLVRVSGIVISASTLSAKATHLHLVCKGCRHVRTMAVGSGFSGASLPRKCGRENDDSTADKQCPLDPYQIVHDKSRFVDQQVLKLQESPDAVPVGELPRHIVLTVDRYLCATVTAGSKVTVSGTFSIFQRKSSRADSSVAVRQAYVRTLGIEADNKGTGGRSKNVFTAEEENFFLEFARNPDVYKTFCNSIAPSIFGNDDMKRAVACLLAGGSKKILPDGVRLRGDINVLLLGDPGTAKSQLLKFAQQVSPIAVYTSGKGSSAAGLTASVIRDPASRDFILEGGAMVLGDGGIVCIDEFDKMRDEDRVAIHEAMEQQTISIAKAGITTVLNSRTSVLAAANPIFGRYDDTKSAGDNIDFQSTILSRFDMIFIVRDEHNEERDITLAKHLMNLHMNRAAPDLESGELDIQTMKNYISYIKAKCAPVLSEDAAQKLSSHFVQIRRDIREIENDTNTRSSIPITIRQLEAIVRVTEAVAKLHLSPIATEEHVDEALRLFKLSTFNAASVGQNEMHEGANIKLIQTIQRDLDRRLPLNSSISERHIVNELVEQGNPEYAVQKALLMLERKGIIQYRNDRKKLFKARMG